MDKRLELILKNQERAARDHEVMISAFQKNSDCEARKSTEEIEEKN